MGRLTGPLKNIGLNAMATAITHLGLATKGPSRSPTASAATDTFTDVGHGYGNGDLVVLSALTGGAGLNEGDPYFVVDATTNTYQLSMQPGGTPVNITTDLSVATANRLTEITGEPYERGAIAWGSAAYGLVSDSTNGTAIPVPGGAVVDYVLGFGGASGGSALDIDDVTQETFGSAGTYTVTNKDIDLNAVPA